MTPQRNPPPAPVALAALLLLGACAAPSAPSASAAGGPASARTTQRCFMASEVNGWQAAGDQTLYVRVGVNRVFRMKLMGPCPDIDWSQAIGIEHTGSPQICSGLDATIISRSTIGPQRCPVTSLQELTPAEIAALPARQRP